MDKKAATSRLNKEETVQQLIERHGKFIEKLREVKVRNPVRFPCRDMVMGRLSNGNGNGREDVTQEVNSCFFKLHCSYPSSFNLSNDGYFFFRSWILKGCMWVHQRKRKIVVLCFDVFTSSIKREIGKVHVVVVKWRQRNVQKRVIHVQSCCFANLSLLLFRRPRWCRRRRCLRSLVTLHD